MLDLLLDHISTVDFILLNVALGLSIYLTLAVGLLSLANAGFLAIGAYTAAILATQAGWPPLAALAPALLCGALVAAPLGLLLSLRATCTLRVLGRLSGAYARLMLG